MNIFSQVGSCLRSLPCGGCGVVWHLYFDDTKPIIRNVRHPRNLSRKDFTRRHLTLLSTLQEMMQ